MSRHNSFKHFPKNFKKEFDDIIALSEKISKIVIQPDLKLKALRQIKVSSVSYEGKQVKAWDLGCNNIILLDGEAYYQDEQQAFRKLSQSEIIKFEGVIQSIFLKNLLEFLEIVANKHNNFSVNDKEELMELLERNFRQIDLEDKSQRFLSHWTDSYEFMKPLFERDKRLAKFILDKVTIPWERLFMAVEAEEAEDFDFFRYLIEGVKPDVFDISVNIESEDRILHFALKNKYPKEYIELLLAQNCDLMQTNDHGKFPLDLAIENCDKEIVAMVIQSVALRCSDLNLLKQHLEKLHKYSEENLQEDSEINNSIKLNIGLMENSKKIAENQESERRGVKKDEKGKGYDSPFRADKVLAQRAIDDNLGARAIKKSRPRVIPPTNLRPLGSEKMQVQEREGVKGFLV